MCRKRENAAHAQAGLPSGGHKVVSGNFCVDAVRYHILPFLRQSAVFPNAALEDGRVCPSLISHDIDSYEMRTVVHFIAPFRILELYNLIIGVWWMTLFYCWRSNILKRP